MIAKRCNIKEQNIVKTDPYKLQDKRNCKTATHVWTVMSCAFFYLGRTWEVFHHPLISLMKSKMCQLHITPILTKQYYKFTYLIIQNFSF